MHGPWGYRRLALQTLAVAQTHVAKTGVEVHPPLARHGRRTASSSRPGTPRCLRIDIMGSGVRCGLELQTQVQSSEEVHSNHQKKTQGPAPFLSETTRAATDVSASRTQVQFTRVRVCIELAVEEEHGVGRATRHTRKHAHPFARHDTKKGRVVGDNSSLTH